ncbi:MAG: putative lipid II flippase FtsW [Gammaproteobacteria bacterium]|nr:putative lipid II flippase FtsW [Gammaproteobacteria bacterium]
MSMSSSSVKVSKTSTLELLQRSMSAPGQPNTLLVVMFLLMTFGLLMMTSASIEIANGQYNDPFFFFKRQLFFSVLTAVIVVITLTIPVRAWYSISLPLLLLSFALLALVLVPGVGRVVNGSARWIDLGFYNLQPSEFAKIFIVVYLAAYLERHRFSVMETWVGFIKPMVILAGAIVLLHFEPDHGAMVILIGTTFSMIFLAGAKLHRFALVLMLSVSAVAALAIMKPYVLDRFSSFLNPWAAEYVYGEGYQLTQALIAFGRGGWFGEGLGNSIQKLYFLPEAHTDFVLAIVAEEFGFVGVSVVVGLFITLVAQAFKIGKRVELSGNLFPAYLAYGIAMLFACQTLINVGVNIGLLPTKGLTLPFLSYGGNSLLISGFMVAVLVRIDYEYAQSTLKSSLQTVAGTGKRGSR